MAAVERKLSIKENIYFQVSNEKESLFLQLEVEVGRIFGSMSMRWGDASIRKV